MAKYVQQKVRIQIPTGYTPSQREEAANIILDTIKYRTQDKSLDKKQKSFADYSKEYAKEKGSSKVNLTKTGDMLDNLELLTHRSGWITIGYNKDYDGMGKVEGNRKGTYGQSKPISGKARDFLGVNRDEVLEVLRELIPPDSELAKLEEELTGSARSLTDRQLRNVKQSLFQNTLAGLSSIGKRLLKLIKGE